MVNALQFSCHMLREAAIKALSALGDPRGIAAMPEWLDGHWAKALGAFKDFADAEFETETKTQQEKDKSFTAPQLGRPQHALLNF